MAPASVQIIGRSIYACHLEVYHTEKQMSHWLNAASAFETVVFYSCILDLSKLKGMVKDDPGVVLAEIGEDNIFIYCNGKDAKVGVETFEPGNDLAIVCTVAARMTKNMEAVRKDFFGLKKRSG